MGRGTHEKESVLVLRTGRVVGASCSVLWRLSKDFEMDLVEFQRALNPKLLKP